MTEQRPRTETELVEFVQSIDVSAPPALHERVEAITRESARERRGRTGRSLLRPAAAAGVAIAVALALVLVLTNPFSGSSQSVLHGAVASAGAAATHPAPAQDAAAPRQLDVSVGSVVFPYWEDALGLRATGMRRDVIAGRPSVTVFYESPRGQRVGYTIVGGTPAPDLKEGRTLWRAGTDYHLIAANGLRVVAWLRDGHACVLAARNASYATLLHLATWSV